MASLEVRGVSLGYCTTQNERNDFIGCPFPRKGAFCTILCRTLFRGFDLSKGCPCDRWGKDYSREYYWLAMNPF